jgi:hypothetical protein
MSRRAASGSQMKRVLTRLLFGCLRPRRSPARPVQTFFPFLFEARSRVTAPLLSIY